MTKSYPAGPLTCLRCLPYFIFQRSIKALSGKPLIVLTKTEWVAFQKDRVYSASDDDNINRGGLKCLFPNGKKDMPNSLFLKI
jgi:hypothetical protein